MRTILNILNFILGGFATTLGWLLAPLVSIILCHAAVTRSCWEITRLSLFPYGNEAIHLTSSSRGAKRSTERRRYRSEHSVVHFFRLVALPDANIFSRYSSVPGLS